MTRYALTMTAILLAFAMPVIAGNVEQSAVGTQNLQIAGDSHNGGIENDVQSAHSNINARVAMSRDDVVYPGDISGAVSSDLGGVLAGVYVFVEGNANHDLTDADGNYFLEGVDAGQVSVSFIKAGYYDTTVVDVTVESHITTTLNVVLHNEGDAEVIIWYGNMDVSPIQVSLGQRLEVNTYIGMENYVYINNILLAFGAQDQYVDSLLSVTEGQVFDPFPDWDWAEFREPFGSPPNPEGWSSQPFIGFACTFPIPGQTYPWLHYETPTLGMKFVIKTSTDSANMGQLVHGIGPGLDPQQGPSNAGDTTGDVNFQISEHYSPLYFAGRHILGQVTNQNSQPLSDVYVEIIDGPRHDFTNTTGNYVLNDLLPGYYDVRFSHPSCQEEIRNNVRVYSYQNTTLNVQMQELGNLGGLVTDPEAAPIESVLVTIEGTGLTQYTSPAGEYFFGLIETGGYTVTYSHPDYFDQTRSVDITGGDTTIVNVEMPYLGAIDGLVKDVNDVLLENVHVVLNTTGRSEDTDADGHFFFGKVDPGTYSITLTHPDYHQQTVSGIGVTSGDTTEIQVTMELLAVISGTVTKTDGTTPLEGVYLQLKRNNNPVDSYTTGPDGNFEFNHLLEGIYNITASKSGYVTQTVSGINAQYDDTTIVNILLVENIGSISGNITGNGSPLDSVHVTAIATLYQDFSDVSGDYEMTSMPGGSYNLKFFKPGFQDYYSMNVVVLPEETTVLNITMDEKQYDLAVSLFSNPFYRSGEDGFYSCVCRSLGSNAAANAVLQLDIPDEVTYISSSPSGDFAGGVVTWNIGEFAALDVMNFQVNFNVPGDVPIGEYLSAEANLSTDSPDDDLTNNYASVTTQVLDSWNAFDKMASPPGVGTSKFISGTDNLMYNVFFENEAGSPGNITNILVSDTLDLDLDWDTFVLGPVSHEANCTVALDYSARAIGWDFADVGLPPNNVPPEGEGFVTYFVMPYTSSPNETEITNRAGVKFDDAPWELCPGSGPLLRTLDKLAPTSNLAEIPENIFGDTVTLSWSANDFGGAGIDFVELYVSVNDGSYNWLYSAPSGVYDYLFQGEFDSCYSFYSIAVDAVGNRETEPSGPDAQTCFAVGYLYLAGDVNMYNGGWPPVIIGGDVTYLIGYFRGFNEACYLGGFFASGDVNGDCHVYGSDVTYLIAYFRGLVPHPVFCPDYIAAWPNESFIPAERPEGWPNCENMTTADEKINVILNEK